MSTPENPESAPVAVPPPSSLSETQKKNADLLYEIVMALGAMQEKIDGECTTIGTVKALVERWNRSGMALRELERIRGTRLAACGCCEEATSVSRSRVLLQIPFAPWENVNRPDIANTERQESPGKTGSTEGDKL